MFWVELIIVLAMIFLGTRKGGPFLALAGLPAAPLSFS